jgi:hypothetical protein
VPPTAGPEVREDCRHYLGRTTPAGDVTRRCRLAVNAQDPFSCPEGCLFFEERAVAGPGWAQAPAERMSNTADGLADLPKPKKPKRRKRT